MQFTKSPETITKEITITIDMNGGEVEDAIERAALEGAIERAALEGINTKDWLTNVRISLHHSGSARVFVTLTRSTVETGSQEYVQHLVEHHESTATTGNSEEPEDQRGFQPLVTFGGPPSDFPDATPVALPAHSDDMPTPQPAELHHPTPNPVEYVPCRKTHQRRAAFLCQTNGCLSPAAAAKCKYWQAWLAAGLVS